MHRVLVAVSLLACAEEPSLVVNPERGQLPMMDSLAVNQEVRRGPEVLFVVMDTLRPDVLGCYGGDPRVAPSVDALAAQGVLFEDVTAAGSWTWPVHASLFTGLAPWEHGAHRRQDGDQSLGSLQVQTLDPSLPTLASRFRAAGYATRSVSGNGLLHPQLGLMSGFEQAEVFNDRDDQVLSQAEAWIRTEERSLFLFVNLLGGHLPYVDYSVPWESELVAGSPFEEAWVEPWLGEHPLGASALRLNRVADGREHGLVLEVAGGERRLDESQFASLQEAYRQDVWGTDQRLGALIEAWDRRTSGEGIVILTSDHGEHFGEQGLLDHGHMLHGVNTRVPLIIRVPDQAPRRVSQPVSQLALTDTVLRLAEQSADSEGLMRAIRGAGMAAEPILARSWADPVWARDAGSRFVHGQRMVRIGDWALIATEDGGRSLFDVSVDPLMRADLAESRPDRVEQLASWLSWMDEKEGEIAALPPTAEMQDALEALGYVEP